MRKMCPKATVLPLEDMRSDDDWSDEVDRLVQRVYSHQNAILYSGRDGFAPHYHGDLPVEVVNFATASISGTERRELLGTHYEDDPKFRAGMIHMVMNLPHRTCMTVDMACIRRNSDDKVEVVMVRKPHEKQWRFPGGFLSPGESFAQAAAREFREETGLICEGTWTFVGDFTVDDWRVRAVDDLAYRTALMFNLHSHGRPEGGDDVAYAEWVPLFMLKSGGKVVEEHRTLLQALFEHLATNPPEFFTQSPK